MTSYFPAIWAGLKLPMQTGGLRLTGPIPLNIDNQIKIAAPERIAVDVANKQILIYPVAVIWRRMDYEILRMQAVFQKERVSAPKAGDPSHVKIKVRTSDGKVHEAMAEDLAKPPTPAPQAEPEDSPFSLDLDYAFQGVTVSDFQIERSRIGAQATTREYVFDLRAYFPAIDFGSGPCTVQIETLGLTSNEVSTLIETR